MDNILFFTYPLNGLLMIALPIALGIYLTRRFQIGWRLWWIGGATFVISQIGHLPFNSLVTYIFQAGILPVPAESWKLVFDAIFLGLSAGMWEECTRYAVYRWWAKDARTWRKAVLIGAGHGGIEAILLGALVLFAFVQMTALRDMDLSAVVPPDQVGLLQQQVAAYWSAPWYATLLGAVERSFALPTHIALSVIMLQVFIRGKIRWLLLAIGWHAFVNAITGIVLGTWGAYATEAVLAIIALIDIIIIFALKTPEPDTSPSKETRALTEPIPPTTINLIEETPENLDRTRYN
ncbi:MAG: YhfC family glutamic-type intramembrane protease [Anaerolineales bacterium]|jgi:uncharacterized membrane protein YhfC